MSTTSVKDRRQQVERRHGSERRRQSEARRAIIEVCRSMLHFALVARSANGEEDRDRVVTRSIRWRKEATSLHTERGVQELTEAFRTLVTEERLNGARVRIALGGEFCVTRVITGATEDVRREFSELEERSLRYLTLGPGPKALAGSTQQLDARHQHALLAVANQRTLDQLMRIGEEVGLQIESIEPSLIALSRAQARLRDACQEACIMIQLDEDAAELGICHGGRLLLDYRPGGHTNAENVASIVARHSSRLQRFLERYHSYLDAPLRHVYLAGDADAVARAQTKFGELPDFKVHVVEPGDLEMPWDHAADTPGTDLAATLGTAMALYSDSAEEQGPNLIESALAQQREPIRPILIKSLIPFAAVLLVAVGLFVVRIVQWREIAALHAEVDDLAPACARATELRLKLTVSDDKLTQLRALEKGLPQANWPQVLDRIRQSMPGDVWLERLTIHDGSATLTGASYSDTGVYEFVNFLKKVPNVDAALEGTGVGQGSLGTATNFTLQLTLANSDGRNDKENRHD
jgi:Tfp pilus assembly protein PilN